MRTCAWLSLRKGRTCTVRRDHLAEIAVLGSDRLGARRDAGDSCHGELASAAIEFATSSCAKGEAAGRKAQMFPSISCEGARTVNRSLSQLEASSEVMIRRRETLHEVAGAA